ncbi:MAG: DUF4019 domain-containing protein [Limisphaerales bacterium]
MKFTSLPSRVAALLITATVIAAVTSGCGKTNQTTEQSTNSGAGGQPAASAAAKPDTTNADAEKAATAAAQKWLAEIDNGQYTQSWQDASAAFQGAVSREKWESALDAVRKPLGNLESRHLESAQYTTRLPGAPAGTYVVMQFDTSFANKKSAVETVTFSLESDGNWKASGYYIK